MVSDRRWHLGSRLVHKGSLMPNARMMIICNAAGCNSVVPFADKYCRDHKLPPISPPENITSTPERTDEQRARHRLYDRAWRKRRTAQLADSPWCARCLKRNKYIPATDVHHVIAHRGDRGVFISSPLESLCHTCHSIVTRLENNPPLEESFKGEC